MKQIEEWLRSRSIDEVECLIPDMAGIPRGKILPAEKYLKSIRENGLRLPESIFIQTVTGQYADEEDEAVTDPANGDIYLQPDAGTIRLVPWYDAPTAQIIHDCVYADGRPVDIAPRTVLKRVLELYAERGWRPNSSWCRSTPTPTIRWCPRSGARGGPRRGGKPTASTR